MKLASLAALAALLAGCAYQAPVAVSPNLDVYSSYGDKLPGSYALYISDQDFEQDVKATGLSCSAHHYPINLEGPFKASVEKTVRELVDDVEVVDRPLNDDELGRSGKRGMIVVRGDTIDARVQVVPGFWHGTATATVDLSANMTVDLPTGRVLGTTAEGSGNANSDAGQLCGGAANALGDATDKAMKRLLGELGERLSNSPRLRAGVSGPAPAAVPASVSTAPTTNTPAASASPTETATAPSSRAKKKSCVQVVTDPDQNKC